MILLAVRLPHGRNTLFVPREWCYLSFVLRAVLIAVAMMFAATSIPDAEAGRKPAASSKWKMAKKKTVKKAPSKKRVAKKAVKKPRKKRRTVEADRDSGSPRRPLP